MSIETRENFTAGALCPIEEKEARMKHPLALAYIGDTVYDLYVRANLLKKSTETVNMLNRRACRLVNAKAQAEAAEVLLEWMTEAEGDIFRRGRNAKSATIPKNMSVSVYHRATALEAVVGYLFLTGQYGRLEQMFEKILQLGEDCGTREE